MVQCRSGNKPLSEIMLDSFTYAYMRPAARGVKSRYTSVNNVQGGHIVVIFKQETAFLKGFYSTEIGYSQRCCRIQHNPHSNGAFRHIGTSQHWFTEPFQSRDMSMGLNQIINKACRITIDKYKFGANNYWITFSETQCYLHSVRCVGNRQQVMIYYHYCDVNMRRLKSPT